jgi:hypothetical protein
VASRTLTWIRRLSFVLVLAVVAVAPGPSAGSQARLCRELGAATVNGAQACARPELVALNR